MHEELTNECHPERQARSGRDLCAVEPIGSKDKRKDAEYENKMPRVNHLEGENRNVNGALQQLTTQHEEKANEYAVSLKQANDDQLNTQNKYRQCKQRIGGLQQQLKSESSTQSMKHNEHMH
eukprot:634323_1